MVENRGVGQIKKFKTLENQQSQPSTLKSKLLYLTNGDTLEKVIYIFGITRVENGGVGHLKTSKKVCPKIGNTHVTIFPKVNFRVPKVKSVISSKKSPMFGLFITPLCSQPLKMGG